MKIRHYATFSTQGKGFFPDTETFILPSNKITDIQLPETAIKIVTFDRIISEIVYDGKKLPVATKQLNKKTYHIGKFQDIKNYLDKGNFYQALKENGCIGMVITRNGKDNIVYNGEFVIDPKYINKDGYYDKSLANTKKDTPQATTKENPPSKNKETTI